jgi:hypothetical protein
MTTIMDLRAKPSLELIDQVQGLVGRDARVIDFSNHEMRRCIGCWSCWVKTPGKCVMTDVVSQHYTDYVNSDQVVLLLDTRQGFIDHRAKVFIDRLIPHYHPYIELVDGECHHKARYKGYPDLYFYYEESGLLAGESAVIEDYLYRTAYHFQSKAYRIKLAPKVEAVPLLARPAKNKVVKADAVKPSEKLVIYNGSPRLKGSNTALILQEMVAKYGDRIEIRDLKQTENWLRWAESFKDEGAVIMAMPLYVHAMPSHVMAFIEMLKPSDGSLGFIVQQGFPESSQSYYLEAYFEKLSERLGRDYMGTAIKGGMEGLQLRPVQAQQQMILPFVELVDSVFESGKMSELAKATLAGRPYMSWHVRFLYTLLAPTGLTNFYWNMQLKQNGAYEKRHATPFRVVGTKG